MPASIFGNPAAVVQLNQALFGIAPGNGKYTNQLDQANAVGAIPFARQLGQTVAATNEALAATVLANVGIVNATLQTALVQAFAAFPNDRGVVVLNLTNILTTLEGNAVYGAAAAQFNAQVATDFQYSTNSVNTTDSPITAGTVTLTANTDTVTGNLFNAGLVFTPGGDDRINSLQDEDVLTGTGTNATLNATLGNANDNGGAIITPTISGVSTINVAFSGSGGAGNTAVTELDLQDATGTITNLNITRVNDGIGVGPGNAARIDNIGNAVANLSVSRSGQVAQNVDFAFTAGALAGAADSTTLTLNQVNINNLFVEERLTNFDEGFETINLVSGGTSPNSVVLFQAEDLQTLNISGGARLTLGGTASTVGAQGIEATRYTGGLGQVAGSLTAINASTLTAGLDIVLGRELTAGLDGTSGLPVNLTVTGGSGNDTFRLAAGTALAPVGIQAGDRIIGGAAGGTDVNTLQLLGNNTIATDGTAANGPTVTRVQNLDIRNGQDLELDAAAAAAAGGTDTTAIDARAIADLATVVIRNEGQATIGGAATSTFERSVVNLTNVNAATANGIVVLHGTTGNSGILTNVINVNSTLAGVTTGGLTIRDGINSNPQFNVAVRFDSDGTALNATNTVVNVNLVDQDTESNTVQLTEFVRHTGTLNITGTGNTGNFFNLDSTGNAYRYAQDGSANNGVVGAPGARAEVGAGAAERLQFSVIDSTTYLGNVVARVGLATTPTTLGAQTVRFGTGNDTVIFDVLNDTRAGFSIADTISGGAGTDVLAIDGNAVRITLAASEFENTTGFEILRFIGNDFVGTAAGAFGTNSINVALSDGYITNNANGGRVITVINDNDSRNDTGLPTQAAQDAEARSLSAGVAGLGATSQSEGITLDLRALSAGFGINYNGEEGTAATNANQPAPVTSVAVAADANNPASVATAAGANVILARTTSADRFIFADRNINSTSIVDGGAVDNVAQLAAAYVVGTDGLANADVLEVRNQADVSVGDLQNIRNVGTLAFNVDLAVAQSFTVQLNDTTIDNLVDSFHTATIVEREARLIVDADDGTIVGGGAAQITLDATQVTSATRFDFRDDTTVNGTAIDVITVAARNAGGAGNVASFSDQGDTYAVVGGNGGNNIQVTTAGEVYTINYRDAANNNLATDAVTNILGAVGATLDFSGITGATFLNYTGGADNDSVVGTLNADVIVGGAGNDTITGGAGADNLTGGTGTDSIILTETAAAIDTVVQNVGDSVALSASMFVAANMIADGDTLTFGNGVDVVTGFQAGGLATGDRVDAVVNTAFVSLVNQDSANLTDNTLFVTRGNFNAGTGVFTFAVAGNDTLVVQNNGGAQDVLTTNTTSLILVGVTNLVAADVF